MVATSGFAFEDSVAMVTGAGQEIGAAVCHALACKGAWVACADAAGSKAEKVVQAILDSGGKARAFELDVSNKTAIDNLFRSIFKEQGRLDILINAADFMNPVPFMEISESEWDYTLSTNLKGTFLCSQAAFRMMQRQSRGRIVNISSWTAKTGGMAAAGRYVPYAHYAASKAAVETLTRSMAFEGAAHGILVNAVAAGPVMPASRQVQAAPEDADAIDLAVPMGRSGLPAEIAAAVVFLASSQADFITAKVLDVNGGLLMD
jgi:3-oxoacyl-[acyl-carrier protein] reductase